MDSRERGRASRRWMDAWERDRRTGEGTGAQGQGWTPTTTQQRGQMSHLPGYGCPTVPEASVSQGFLT